MNMITIKYQRWGGQLVDVRWWTAVNEDGDVINYHTKEFLIEMCKKENLDYRVATYHNNGMVTFKYQNGKIETKKV